MRHHAPLRHCSHDPALSIAHVTQAVLPPGCLFRHHGQGRSHHAPCFIASIAGIVLSFHLPCVPNVQNRLEKIIFRSLTQIDGDSHNTLCASG